MFCRLLQRIFRSADFFKKVIDLLLNFRCRQGFLFLNTEGFLFFNGLHASIDYLLCRSTFYFYSCFRCLLLLSGDNIIFLRQKIDQSRNSRYRDVICPSRPTFQDTVFSRYSVFINDKHMVKCPDSQTLPLGIFDLLYDLDFFMDAHQLQPQRANRVLLFGRLIICSIGSWSYARDFTGNNNIRLCLLCQLTVHRQLCAVRINKHGDSFNLQFFFV